MSLTDSAVARARSRRLIPTWLYTDLATQAAGGYWVVALILQLLFWNRLSQPWLMTGSSLLLALVILGIAWLSRNLHPKWRVPMMIVIAIICFLGAFTQMAIYITEIHPRDYEPELIAFDHWLLAGITAVEALEAWMHPVAVDYFQISYFSYYFLPIILFIALWAKERYRDAEIYFGTMMFGFVSVFFGYLAVPARSPYVIHAELGDASPFHFTQSLEGGVITHTIRGWLDAAEANKRDCFPSGHTQISLMVLLFAWRYMPRWATALFAVAVVSLIFSTLYLRYHYIIDLFAGAALAALIVWLGPKWFEFMERKKGEVSS